MIFIGEKINGTRKSIKAAVLERDAEQIRRTALEQAEAGADYLDVNAGTSPDRELEDMLWLVDTVQAAVDLPLCIDSPSPSVLRAAADRAKAPPIINSVNADPQKIEAILPLVRDLGCGVIALALDESRTGMPRTLDERMENVDSMMRGIERHGIAIENVFIDPLIMSVSTDNGAGPMAFEAIRRIRSAYPGAHITGGLSNISFGLPRRELVNRVFLALAMAAGMDSAVLDPANTALIETLKATELLLARDRFCRSYTKAAKSGFSRK
ncbi:MAG: dihydropteroate synthase [Clostridiales Family XIII bacterium]|jgi:5-methyltetrahydrofolate--homocysteine methyltransferase|nr:dihydropteroate synthase [Clostridiales Family XIII bacterium]